MTTILKNKLNPYYFIPFVLWCIIGALLYWFQDTETLFSAVNLHHHPYMDKAMEWITHLGEGWVIAAIGLVLLLFPSFRNIWFVMAVVVCTVLPSLVTQWIKYQVGAPRPLSVYEHQGWVHHLPHWEFLYHNSFPSGHTTGAFSFFCLLSCMMPVKYRYWGLVFFLLALATAYSRLYLAAHFFIDVYVGSIIGTLLSFALCQLVFYFKAKWQNAKLSS